MSPGFAPPLSPRAISTSVRESPLLEHEIDAALAAELPDDARFAAREYLDDAPFPAARSCRWHALRRGRRPRAAASRARRDRGRRCRHRAAGNRTRRDARARARSRGRDAPSGSIRRRGSGSIGRRAPSRACAASSARRCCSLWISNSWRESLERERLPGLLHRRERSRRGSGSGARSGVRRGVGVLRAARHQRSLACGSGRSDHSAHVTSASDALAAAPRTRV